MGSINNEQNHIKKHFNIINEKSNIFFYSAKIFNISSKISVINNSNAILNNLKSVYHDDKSLKALYKKLIADMKIFKNNIYLKYNYFKYTSYKKALLIKSMENLEFVSSNPVYFLFYFNLVLRSIIIFFPNLKSLQNLIEKYVENLNIIFKENEDLNKKELPSIYTIKTKSLIKKRYCCLTIININTIINKNYIREIIYDCNSILPDDELKYKPIIKENEIIIDGRGVIDNPSLIWNKEYKLEEYSKYSRMSINILSILFAFINNIEIRL